MANSLCDSWRLKLILQMLMTGKTGNDNQAENHVLVGLESVDVDQGNHMAFTNTPCSQWKPLLYWFGRFLKPADKGRPQSKPDQKNPGLAGNLHLGPLRTDSVYKVHELPVVLASCVSMRALTKSGIASSKSILEGPSIFARATAAADLWRSGRLGASYLLQLFCGCFWDYATMVASSHSSLAA